MVSPPVLRRCSAAGLPLLFVQAARLHPKLQRLPKYPGLRSKLSRVMLLVRSSRRLLAQRPRCRLYHSTAIVNDPPEVLRVAIVGRPNVGKSTLFNRLTGGPGGPKWSGGAAIVNAIPGTTRDRKDGKCWYGGIDMLITDTGGLEGVDEEAFGMKHRVNEQVRRAVKEADTVLFVVDSREGLVPEDEHLARWLHKMGVKGKTVVIANKAEGGVLTTVMESTVCDAYGLGLGEPLPISAAHNEGMTDLMQKLHEAALAKGLVPSEAPQDQGDDVITLAFLGLPNVGKSSLLNMVLGEDRVITDATAGTTRDTVMVDFMWNGRKFRLVDTAGIRKRGKRDHTNRLEDLSVEEAVRALRYAQVAVLVLDGQEQRLRRQEQSLVSLAYKEGRALVVVANKADLVEVGRKEYGEGVRKQLEQLAPQLGGVRVLPTSAVTGAGVRALFPAVVHSYESWNRRVSTGLLNRWLEAMVRVHAPPPTGKRTVRLKYMAQVKSRPPTFSLSTNVKEINETYLRFLKKNLQEEFGLHGMDVRLNIRSTSESNPYAYKARGPRPSSSGGRVWRQRPSKPGDRHAKEDEGSSRVTASRDKVPYRGASSASPRRSSSGPASPSRRDQSPRGSQSPRRDQSPRRASGARADGPRGRSDGPRPRSDGFKGRADGGRSKAGQGR